MNKEDSIYTVLSLFGILALVISIFATLNIRTNLSELSDVNFISLQNGQILIYNSVSKNWTNGVILGVKNLTDLNDVFIANTINGEVLTYNSTSKNWTNLAIPVYNDIDNLTSLQDVLFNNVIDGQILRYDSGSNKWENTQNNVALSSSVPTITYAGLLWFNTTSQKMTVRSADNTAWLDLYVYNALTWDGYLFGDWLNQAVKTGSSPTFSNLVINNNITIGGYIDGIDLSVNINQPVLTTSTPTFNNLTVGTSKVYGVVTIVNKGATILALRQAVKEYGYDIDLEEVSVGRLDVYTVFNEVRTMRLSLFRDSGDLQLYGGTFRANGYKSSDGTIGLTQDVVVLTALPSIFITMHFKNGLFVGTT